MFGTRRPFFLLLLPLLLLVPPSVQAAEELVSDTMQLARQGDREAQFSLGLMYDTGNMVERDPEQAVFWFKKAATAGVAGACLYLGMKYAFGAGVKQDRAKAEHWYERAALQGWPQAAFLLGSLYLNTGDVDRVRGCAWLQIAAGGGYPGAEESRRQLCSGMGEAEAGQAEKLHSTIMQQIYPAEGPSTTR